MNFIQNFPPIRVWGTVGFIVAMWCTDLSGSTLTTGQLYISAGAAAFLGLYGFSMPACPPSRGTGKRSVAEALGLDAFVLFKRMQMVVFFLCAMMLGGALQITNAFGGDFLTDFNAAYPDSFGVQPPDPAVVDLADLRDALHPDHPVLPAALRHQGRDDDRDLRLGVALRAVRLGRPGAGAVDAGDVDDRLRHGFRLLQHLGLDVREPRGERAHPRERPGAVHDHDQRARRLPRHDGRGRGRRPLHGRRRARLAEHLAVVRGLCARARDRVPVRVPVQARPGEDGGRAPPRTNAAFRRRSPAPSAS